MAGTRIAGRNVSCGWRHFRDLTDRPNFFVLMAHGNSLAGHFVDASFLSFVSFPLSFGLTLQLEKCIAVDGRR